MKNAIRSVSVSALCAVMLAGCGSGSAAAASASASADANTLRVGMECNYAPYNWTTTEKTDTSQQITSVDYCDGYDVMMAEKLAEKTNKQVKIVKLDWDNLILSLQNNQIDATVEKVDDIMEVMQYNVMSLPALVVDGEVVARGQNTEEREQEVAFTTPYYVSTEVIIVEKDSDLANATSLEDFSGKKVIGQLNTLYDTIIDQIPNVQHQPGAETFPAAIQALQSGAVDAVTSELPVAKGVVEANPDLTYITFEDGKGFTGADKDASVSVAVRKDDKDLLDSLQSALDTISDDEREQMMETAVKNQPASQD